ncbi:MAG TPA: pyridoxamine 5'-phosphate oxidase [Gemmatimonadales bacterium]|nr:pyridoxamine 5'-phosphate oxidase [Gemmatimonadales bacterium]
MTDPATHDETGAPVAPAVTTPLATALADLRRDYARARLDEADVLSDPIAQFRRWMDEALAARLSEPTAMTLATAGADGAPDARIVLLKGLDARGFVFYTDYRSRKAQELAANPRAALVFHWHELERQVRVTGAVERIGREESEVYYASRPLGSRLGAWASHQSQVIPGRDWLEHQVAEVEARFAGTEPPLPPHWGGFRVSPARVEFWQGRPSRLHDRIRYTREGGAWRVERLSP